MRLSITTESDTCSLEVAEDLELINFKALCEMEVSVPAEGMRVLANGRPLEGDHSTLAALGVKDGDLLMVLGGGKRPAPQQQSRDPLALDFTNIKVPAHLLGNTRAGGASTSTAPPARASPDTDPARLHSLLMNSPDQLARLTQTNPMLADAAKKGQDEFTKVFEEQEKVRLEEQRKRIKLLTADPFDLEAQQLIQEEIKRKNIDANMEAAMEHSPESFGTVQMLYINCSVNGHPLKAFVDSGAQTTIMSVSCAERCGIMRLVDTRWAGIAKGVGEQKILGRVHCVPIEIDGAHLTSSFSILEEQSMEMLLGLDMLRRHQMIIDMHKCVLKIGTSDTQTPFLQDADLPEHIKLTNASAEAALKESADAAKAEEDRVLAETLAASAQSGESSASAQAGESSDADKPKSEAASQPADTPMETEEASGEEFPPDVVSELVAVGFSKEEAIEALRLHNGEKSDALSYLYAKKFAFS